MGFNTEPSAFVVANRSRTDSYCHLNPLRAGLVSDLKALDKFPYCGHSVLMGKRKNDWQYPEYILKLFNSRYSVTRRCYRDYVKKGIAAGQRPDLVGGGLIRSAGGWSVVKALQKSAARIKGDERILGDGAFVETVLSVISGTSIVLLVDLFQ